MRPADAWLIALRQPERSLDWRLADWQRVTRLARRLRLLGRLAEAIHGAGLEDRLPPRVQQHLLAERRTSRYRVQSLRWATTQVERALCEAKYPRVLLKGAAYTAQELPIAAGRMPSDLDVLVPRENLGDAHKRLREHGWQEITLDDHDQRYYRDYSHELPPLRHPRLALELDLHHAILPPIATITVSASLLLARSIRVGESAWRVLCPTDQVLHCAAHLFLDSELRDRFRDLVDLDGLLRHHSSHHPAFWRELVHRASELGLQHPLALALHYTSKWLDTPVPIQLTQGLVAHALTPLHSAWLLPLLDTVLTPAEPDAHDTWRQDLAASVLLARYHAHRMPVRILLPHLLHKLRTRGRKDDAGAAP